MTFTPIAVQGTIPPGLLRLETVGCPQALFHLVMEDRLQQGVLA
jgi:hypothetical protein